MLIVGEYNRHGYRIWDVETGNLLYTAGNCPFESTTVLDTWDRYAEPLHTIRSHCLSTAQEIAAEHGAGFGGVERVEEEF